MKNDPMIADLRAAREDLSKRFGGDLSKIVDFLNQEERKAAWLRNELKAGAEASRSEFMTVDADSLIAEAKAQRKADGG
jgi:hypothetical protein